MLSRTAQYALRALVHLARQHEDDFHQTQNIASHLRIPPNYLGKILQKLTRPRIVESQKGLQGGFRIARLPDQISLYDILDALDALPRDAGPRTRHAQHEPVELTNLQQRFASIYRIYTKFLKETTLASVMYADKEASRPGLKASDYSGPQPAVLAI